MENEILRSPFISGKTLVCKGKKLSHNIHLSVEFEHESGALSCLSWPEVLWVQGEGAGWHGVYLVLMFHAWVDFLHSTPALLKPNSPGITNSSPVFWPGSWTSWTTCLRLNSWVPHLLCFFSVVHRVLPGRTLPSSLWFKLTAF